MSNARIRLAEALRDAVDAACRTRVDDEGIWGIADEADRLVLRLRAAGEARPVEGDLDRRLLYSAGHGPGNPLSPRRLPDAGDPGFASRVRLSAAHEGYAGIAHGGVTALLLDDVLGRFTRSIGRGGKTGQLNIAFLLPVPIEQDLIVRARLDRIDGRKTHVIGEVVTASVPDDLLARATGLFITNRMPDPAIAV